MHTLLLQAFSKWRQIYIILMHASRAKHCHNGYRCKCNAISLQEFSKMDTDVNVYILTASLFAVDTYAYAF
jgi:hypothetical protein